MMMAFEDQLTFIWWNFELQMKTMDDMGLEQVPRIIIKKSSPSPPTPTRFRLNYKYSSKSFVRARQSTFGVYIPNS